jgi:hypothetical protein
MKEDFLHYLWKFKKFDVLNLKTFNGGNINVSQYLELAGPDFFNAQITIGNQKWANVEIHLKSSDWYVHHRKEMVRKRNSSCGMGTRLGNFRKNNTEILF